jgi:hypothetical protein
MKFTFLLSLLLLTAAAQTQAPKQDLNQLAWMSGTWAGTQDGVEMEEQWTRPKGNTMLGLHRDIAGERTVSFEFLRIEKTADGISYIAQPGGRPPTSFRLIESAAKRAVFENKAHDFPQRIIYWVEGDLLRARIEGEEKGKKQSMEWSWKKAGSK